MSMKEINRQTMQILRTEIDAAVKAVGEKHGLAIQTERGTFAGHEGWFKLMIKVDDPEIKLAAAREEFNRYCRHYGVDWDRPDETGLRPEDFGTEFAYGAVTYQLIGLYLKGKNSQKFPLKVAVVKDPTHRREVGALIMLPEQAIPLIRLATDAKAKATAKPKLKAVG